MYDTIQCSICDGLFHRESDGELFCLSCLNQWLEDGSDAIECKLCHQPKKKFFKCTRGNFVDCYDEYNFGSGDSEVCSIHNQLQLFYCCTCKKAVCQTCVTYTHERHQHVIKSVADISPHQRQFTRDMYDVVNTRLQKAREYIENIETCLAQVDTCVSEAEKEIDNYVVEAVECIKTKAGEMKKRLKSLQMIKMEDLKEEKSKALLLTKNMETSLTEAAKSVNTCPDHVYVAKHIDINENLLKLCIEQQHQQKDTSGNIKFVPGCLKATEFYCGQLLHRRSVQIENHIGEFKKINAVSGSGKGYLAISDKSSADVVIINCQNKDEICQMHSLKSIARSASASFKKPSSLTFTDTGNIVVLNSTALLVFNVASESVVDVIPLPTSILRRRKRSSKTKIAITTNNEIILGNSKSKRLFVLDKFGEVLRTFYVPFAPATSMCTNENKLALANRACGKIYIMNLNTGEEICTITTPSVESVCFDDSASCLVIRNTVSEMGVIEQYCSSTGQLIGILATGLEHPIGLTILDCDHIAVANKKYIKILQIQ